MFELAFNKGKLADQPICPACCGAEVVKVCLVPDHEYGLKYLGQYVDCAACRTVFQFPMPDIAELSAFYPKNYHSMNSKGLLNRIRHDIRVQRLKSLTDGGGAVLDYGCGDGSFLLRAAERLPGKAFFGFEMHDHLEITSAAQGAVTVVKGSLNDLLQVLPPCRLITMNHVIEHLPNPLEVVSALHAKLITGGTFEGQTPGADSLEHWVFGRSWSGYHAPRHTVVFSQPGLRQLFQRAGFEQIIINGGFNPAGLAVSLGSLPQDLHPDCFPVEVFAGYFV
jgi:SAM-dependent methyltransferase